MKPMLIANVVSGCIAAIIYAVISLVRGGGLTPGLILSSLGIGLVAFLISFAIGWLISGRETHD